MDLFHPHGCREVVLPHAIRYFSCTYGRLSRKGQLPPETKIRLGIPDSVIYDHRKQIAFPFIWNREICYCLLDELGLPELVN